MTLPNLPAVQVATPPETLGGRSSRGNGLLLPAVKTAHGAQQTHTAQNPHQALISLLQPSVPSLASALHGLSGGAHTTFEAIGVGSTGDALGTVIGLLHTQGFQVREAFGGGSTSGYAGPSVVFRKVGGSPVGVFVRQVGLAREGGM